jgi:hypothetical protein
MQITIGFDHVIGNPGLRFDRRAFVAVDYLLMLDK